MALSFPTDIKVPIQNWKTGGRYYVIRAGDALNTGAHLTEITNICNQPEVYRRIFEAPFQGKPYPIEKAVGFLQWAEEGWKNATHFVFLATTEAGEIAAACDIKSNDPEWAEMGYWAGEHHSGIMTNTVGTVCQLAAQAGFNTLFARVEKSNRRSANVLLRSGFQADKEKTLADEKHDWFVYRVLSIH